MSFTRFSEDVVKTRKKHCCDLCGGIIPSASPAVAYRGADEHIAAYTLYYHPECKAKADAEFSADDWENHCVGDMERPQPVIPHAV